MAAALLFHQHHRNPGRSGRSSLPLSPTGNPHLLNLNLNSQLKLLPLAGSSRPSVPPPCRTLISIKAQGSGTQNGAVFEIGWEYLQALYATSVGESLNTLPHAFLE